MNTIATAFIMDLPVSLPDSPENLLRAVENKIKYLKESAHAMMDYRNALVSVTSTYCDTPYHILPSSFEVLDFEPPPPQILTSSVSHVCDRWREISRNCPTTAHAEFEWFLQAYWHYSKEFTPSTYATQ